MRTDKKTSHKQEKKGSSRGHKQGVVGYSRKSALLEEAITHMNNGKYGRSSAALKELLSLDPQNTEARRLFATLHLRLGSLVTAREAFESLANEAIGRQDYWLAESLLREYLAAGPRCIPFLEQLAHVYQEKGDEMAAVTELGKAIEILLEDPDPDNPQKSAQLYKKVRALAPASPVAFQFSSSFDVQTGEFRVARPHDGEEQAVSPPSDPTPAAEPPAELMPWERPDEELSSEPRSPSKLFSSQEPELTPHPLPVSDDLSLPDSPLPSLHSADSVESSLKDSPEATSASSHEALSSLDCTQPLEIQAPEQESVPAEPLLSVRAAEEPEHEIALHESTASTATEPESILARMPWEHVADAALQIVEREMPVESVTDQPGAETFGLEVPETTSVGVEAAAVLSQPEPGLLPSPPDVPLSEPTAPTAPDASRAAQPPVASPVHPSSFSWTAIFDTAWKIAIGTETPAPVVTDNEKGQSSDSQGESTQLEANTGSVSAEIEQTIQTFPSSLQDIPDITPNTNGQYVDPQPGDVVSTETSVPTSNENAVQDVGHESFRIAEPQTKEERAVIQEPVIQNSTAIGEHSEFSYVSYPPADTLSPVSPVPPVAEQIVSVPPEDRDFIEEKVNDQPADVQISRDSQPVEEDQGETIAPVAEAVPAPNISSSDIPALRTDIGASLQPSPDTTFEATSTNSLSPWNTGEVSVQLHRPSAKKNKWDKEQPPIDETPAATPSELGHHDESVSDEPLIADELLSEPPIDTRPEWAQAVDAIQLRQSEAVNPSSLEAVSPEAKDDHVALPSSRVASAVDVLFNQTARMDDGPTHDRMTYAKPRSRTAIRLARLRIALQSLVVSCFSTTRAFVLLCVSIVTLCLFMAALGIGTIALVWIAMEESPSPRYQSMTASPQRVVTDQAKNGYLLLLGLDSPPGQDPIQAGYERKPTEQDSSLALSCLHEADIAGTPNGGSAPANAVNAWFRSADPLARLKGQAETIKPLVSKESSVLSRYQQWLGMPFDDWGYGTLASPDCSRVLLIHRLFVLEGFNQDGAAGIGRLEKDMEAWRGALSQSRTLMVKMMAAAAIHDDTALVSSLLTRPDLDGPSLARLSKLVRPLDQAELSVKWPMQSHLIWAMRNVSGELKKDRGEERLLYGTLAAALPLPVQRRANAYAEYYDAANKAVAEGRYVSLPKSSAFVRNPASGVMDYLSNPVELLAGLEPVPSWDPYVGKMVETDAQLRLASLQAWVRRGPQDADFLARLAKAGQAYYDPFTGLPMLVNQQKRLLYSVGRDGKDQEGDPRYDVAVSIPSMVDRAESKRTSK
ncbi:hypothetical protein W02_22180 [Nitrospira sp. KM1]|uniref:tetratricopeptide repeat protein n=1 Tax=Nitrospira sp. KM1 TaxID=1936990 RepID=UPI0013A71DDD|nr:hypothetical protein [Nitrospira sp. KM1]BCA55078.1 hypothetical protein W02_22180 [Nitrospira sp. KM1]